MTSLPTEGTLLTLSSMGLPLYSARGLTQTLTPIDQAKQMRRDINGALVDLSSQKFRKYTSKITCKDFNAPALDGVYVGMVLNISCVSELSFQTGASPTRPAVSSSTRMQGAFTFYRPILNMMVTGYSTSTEEYLGEVNWELDLEEV